MSRPRALKYRPGAASSAQLERIAAHNRAVASHESAKQEAQRRRAHWSGKLLELRAALREARRALAPRVREVRAACKGARRGLDFRIKEVRAELQRLIHVERKALAKRCKNEPREVREQGLEEIAKRAREYASTRGYVAELRRGGEFRIKGLRSPLHTMSVREQREQSDHEVEVNLPPELIPAWHAKKHEIHATPRSSRTDVFLAWVHDHPADAASHYYIEAENVRELEREEKRAAAEHEKAKGRTKVKRPKRAAVDVDEWGGEPIATTTRTPIRIEYDAISNENPLRGGWLPMIWENGAQKGDTYGTGPALDRDDALSLARAQAEEAGARYVGDWNVSIVQRASKPKHTRGPSAAAVQRASERKRGQMLTRRESGALEEYDRGWSDARKEIRADGWSVDVASRYLESVGPARGAFGRGFDDAIRAFASGQPIDDPRPSRFQSAAELAAPP